ncbi:hypothetical protein ACFS07_20815 [Undibacterium arcticum]
MKSWPVIERYGCIFVWHDPEGGEPDYDFPTIEEWGDPAWVRWKLDDLGTLNVHPIEVVDNMADVRHLGPIHGSTVEYFEKRVRTARLYPVPGRGDTGRWSDRTRCWRPTPGTWDPASSSPEFGAPTTRSS